MAGSFFFKVPIPPMVDPVPVDGPSPVPVAQVVIAPSTPVPSSATYNLEQLVSRGQPTLRASIADRVQTTAIVGKEIPIIYGEEPTGGNVVRAKEYNGKYYVVIVWCEGPVNAIKEVYISGVLVTSEGTHYTGTSTQSADPTVALVWGQADALPGVCYSVYALDSSQELDFVAIIRGHEPLDPRTNNRDWSANALLILADYIDRYSDYTPNWESAKAAADYNDEDPGDGPRWEAHVTLNNPVDHDTNIAALKEYANVFTYIEAGEVYFVADAPRAVDHVLTPDMFRRLPAPLRGPDLENVPTQVICEYTALREGDYIDDEEKTADPAAGEPVRRARLIMPGFRRASMAKRKCIETYNKANLAKYDTELVLFDYGLKVAPGDVLEVTSDIGLTAEKFRALDAYPMENGRWRIPVRYYDPLMWSDQVVTEPTGDSNPQPDPRVVPLVSNLTLVEEQYEVQSGMWRTQVRCTWTAPDYPFNSDYEVIITDGAVKVAQSITTDPIAVFGPLKEGVTYICKVRIRGLYGVGGFAQQSLQALGKTQRPSPPTLFVTFEMTGEVFFRWVSGIDHLDWRGEEIRYGPVGTAWDDMDVVNRWSGTQGSSKLVPVGTWDFEIRTFDSVRTQAEPFGQYSTTGLRATQTVDNDANAFHIDDPVLLYDAAASSGLIDLDGTYVTDGGDTWADMFGANPMSNYPNPVNTYTTDTPAAWVSQIDDLGKDLTVTVQVSYQAYASVGDLEVSIETRKGTTGAWTKHAGTSIKTELQQYRVLFETAAAERIVVPPPYGQAALDVIPITRRGSFTTDGVGSVLVTMPIDFSVFTGIKVSTPGIALRAAYEDPTTGSPTTIKMAILNGSTHVIETGFWEVSGY